MNAPNSFQDDYTTVGSKHFNMLLLVGALIGAVVGYFVGEALLTLLNGAVHAVVLVGIYFAQMMFFIFLAVLICEKMDPRINTRIWTNDHWGKSLLRLPLMTIVAFFALGCLFQFFYGLSSDPVLLQKADDYIIVIDNSGSMMDSDPQRERFPAVESFLNELDESNQVSIILFSDQTQMPLPLTAVDDNLRASIAETLSELQPNGGTDIQRALYEAQAVVTDPSRKTMVILLSDGESRVDVRAVTKLYNDNNLVLNTIDCSGNQFWRSSLLLNLSTSTGGYNYQVAEMNQLAGTLTQILSGTHNDRMLLDYRYGYDRNSSGFAFLRILLITLMGLAMCGALGFMLFSTAVIRSMLKQKPAMALLAGLILEFGLANFWPAPSVRFWMVLFFGLLFTFFQSIITRSSGGDYGNDSQKRGLARQGGSQW